MQRRSEVGIEHGAIFFEQRDNVLVVICKESEARRIAFSYGRGAFADGARSPSAGPPLT